MRAPNLVPLLDVMIVILLFLMLVADFEPRPHEPIRVPFACSTNLCWSCGIPQGPPLNINIHHRDDRTCLTYERGGPCGLEEHWWITIDGRECTEPTYLRTVLAQEASRAPRGGGSPWDRRVLVRCDAAAPTGRAQQALNACARLGFQKISLATTSRHRN